MSGIKTIRACKQASENTLYVNHPRKDERKICIKQYPYRHSFFVIARELGPDVLLSGGGHV
jgi:hypothetical protein